jgi:hypothetical protein
MQIWLIKGLIVLFFIIGGTGAVIWYGSMNQTKGYNKAMGEVAAAQAAANTKVLKTKRENKHVTQNIDRAGIVNELCRRGELRDFENCPK